MFEEELAAIEPPVRRPDPGTIWIRPDGEIWRLRDYAPDWKADDPLRAPQRPSYACQYPTGGNSTGYYLPSDAVLVWTPTNGLTGATS